VTSELDVLLTLQEHDTTLERLLHRHHTLAERDALRDAEAAAAALDARLVTTRAERTIENREFELMEVREPLDATVAELEQQRAAVGADVDRHAAALGAAEAEIIAEMQAERATRDELAAGIDAALVKEYERCRALAKGAGVARLVGTTCQGCHLSIPAVEAEQIKRTGGQPLAHCDNCGAILVP